MDFDPEARGGGGGGGGGSAGPRGRPEALGAGLGQGPSWPRGGDGSPRCWAGLRPQLRAPEKEGLVAGSPRCWAGLRPQLRAPKKEGWVAGSPRCWAGLRPQLRAPKKEALGAFDAGQGQGPSCEPLRKKVWWLRALDAGQAGSWLAWLAGLAGGWLAAGWLLAGCWLAAGWLGWLGGLEKIT